MSEPCRILLICDDDLGCLELRETIGTELRVVPVLGHGDATVVPLEVEGVVASGTWEIGITDRQYQLCIVAITGASPMGELARHPALRGNLSAVLYLVQDIEAAAAGGLRPGRDRVFELPRSRAALLAEIERTLLHVLARNRPPIDDQRCLDLVGALIESGQRSVRPQLTVDDIDGWRYPQVARTLGMAVDQGALLERLVQQGICTRTIVERLRACPSCACHQLSYGESCARCGSVDFARETIIHHFACAHMDTLGNFTQGQDLVCPKCRVTLRQIGRDYEKPTGCYVCRSCAFISSETRVQARCHSCKAQVEPERTVERLVYAYDLTPRADEVVAAQDLVGWDMANVLRKAGTGLYAKSFFLYSLQRELERLKRYTTPVSLVMVRATRLEDVRSSGLESYMHYVQDLWKAATTGLRTLDVPCIWEEGTLALMLPATPLAGAEVVAQRITAVFQARSDAGQIAEELIIAAVVARAEHADAQALMHDAVGALSPGSTTASDLLVLADDEISNGRRAPQA
ncbi:MAG: hypothetical protein H0X38_06090 [Planctomycetes bacterium]|nr:hypothetical protein [Planctomycetota bacterium]